MKKLISIMLSVILCVSLVTACGKASNDTNDTNDTTNQPSSEGGETKTTFGLTPFEERQTLRVGFFAGSPLSIPFYIADQEGFFDELNIDIVYETFTNGPAMMEANSDWDIAGAGEGGVVTGMVGYDIRVIGISDYEDNLALFARPGSELATNPEKPESWKGTSWLYPLGTTAQATLVSALDKMDLEISDVNSINMDVASALTGYMGGEADGLAVWNAIAFRAEDEGFVRITDAGQLGFVAPCATLATEDSLKNKRELLATAYAVFYLTWEWCNESDENMEKAVEYYLESCLDEGIAVDESIAKRVMEWYRAPYLKESIDLMTKTSADDAGLYTSRELLQAEKDILVGFDFFISQGKYTAEDRQNVLDKKLIDPSIALEVKTMLDDLGINY